MSFKWNPGCNCCGCVKSDVTTFPGELWTGSHNPSGNDILLKRPATELASAQVCDPYSSQRVTRWSIDVFLKFVSNVGLSEFSSPTAPLTLEIRLLDVDEIEIAKVTGNLAYYGRVTIGSSTDPADLGWHLTLEGAGQTEEARYRTTFTDGATSGKKLERFALCFDCRDLFAVVNRGVYTSDGAGTRIVDFDPSDIAFVEVYVVRTGNPQVSIDRIVITNAYDATKTDCRNCRPQICLCDNYHEELKVTAPTLIYRTGSATPVSLAGFAADAFVPRPWVDCVYLFGFNYNDFTYSPPDDKKILWVLVDRRAYLDEYGNPIAGAKVTMGLVLATLFPSIGGSGLWEWDFPTSDIDCDSTLVLSTLDADPTNEAGFDPFEITIEWL